MPKISEAKRETRRQQILDAALRCFARDGFHNTTTADIVRESGVSQGALYLYFENKDDIIVALADDRHQSEAIITALAQSEQDPIRGLLSLIELYGSGLSDAARIQARRVGIQGWAEALRSPRIRDSVVGGLSSVRAAIVRLIERGQHTGQIRPEVDPEALSRVLVAMFQGLVLQVTWGEDITLSACGQVVHDMISSVLTPSGLASLAP
ncbi:MAG TPA: TetR/AcrR family transcriptional regulator [Caulobacteraceae bacterium]|jgi:AcrR family transcriptional regulator|nr:TetR/AcrR family transcriptional regulator [Caulobacteraceae bacterium]